MTLTAHNTKPCKAILPALARLGRASVVSPVPAGGKTAAQGNAHMNAKVSITHMIWRNERPRFAPGPLLRKLGYKGRDLRHADGTWFDFKETLAESNRIIAEVAARKDAKSNGQRLPRLKMPERGRTLGELCEALFLLPTFQSREVRDGHKVRRGLSARTVLGYTHNQRTVEQACTRLQTSKSKELRREVESLWNLPASMWTVKYAQSLIDEIERENKLHQARACRAFLSQMWSRLGAHEPGALKSLWRDIEKLPVPEGRVRPWEPAEFWHMLKTADEMGRAEMGDSFALGVSTALRQTDRLMFTIANDTGSHISGKHSKRGHLVTIKKTALLASRLKAAADRRLSHKVLWPHLFIDEQASQPFHVSGDHYRKIFTAIRMRAAETMPSCATLRDQDLKDTNQTWLDRAMVDERVLAMIAGHTESTFRAMQRKHYVAENQVKIDAAVDVIDAYLGEKK
jgi:hypothetical protein